MFLSPQSRDYSLISSQDMHDWECRQDRYYMCTEESQGCRHKSVLARSDACSSLTCIMYSILGQLLFMWTTNSSEIHARTMHMYSYDNISKQDQNILPNHSPPHRVCRLHMMTFSPQILHAIPISGVYLWYLVVEISYTVITRETFHLNGLQDHLYQMIHAALAMANYTLEVLPCSEVYW